MSDLPTAGRSQRARQRRRAHRKTASSSAGASIASQKGLAPPQERDPQGQVRVSGPLKATKAETAPESQAATTTLAAPEAAAAPKGRGLSPLAKQVLLWGAIFGALNITISLVITYAAAPFSNSQKALTDNQALLQGAFCLSTLLSFAVLFFAGERATAKMGAAKHGGYAGVWSVVVALLLGFVVPYLLPPLPGSTSSQTTTPAQPASAGQVVLGTAISILSPAALGFGLGYIGGRYSVWKRGRAQKRQEAVVAS